MRNSIILGIVLAIQILILSCSVSKKISSDFGYHVKLQKLHNRAYDYQKAKENDNAILAFEELVTIDSTLIYPNDRISLYKSYMAKSRYDVAENLLQNTLVLISKMKDVDSKLELEARFSQLLIKHQGEREKKLAIETWEHEKKENDSTFVKAYDTAPEPKGGFDAIQKKLVYPDISRIKRIEGQTVVYVKINVEGKVEETKIRESLDEYCDLAAVNAIKAVDWIPATKEGNPISV